MTSRLVLLYALIVINTVLMAFNLFLIDRPSHAAFNFLCCAVAWFGVLLVERSRGPDRSIDNDDSKPNTDDKEEGRDD